MAVLSKPLFSGHTIYIPLYFSTFKWAAALIGVSTAFLATLLPEH